MTDDTAAVRAAISAAATAQTTIIFFPKGTYKISSTLQINTENLQFVGAGQGAYSAAATTLNFTGTGPLIQLGTDNGQSYEFGYYDGVQGLVVQDMKLVYAGSSNTTLDNGLGTYGAGTYALRDWRGGRVSLIRVTIAKFDYGFWGVQSDVDRFEDVTAYHNHSAVIYLGPHSDQAVISGGWSFANDRVMWFDYALSARINGWQSDDDGTQTTAPFKIGSSWSTGSSGINFTNVWFEQAGSLPSAPGINAFVDIGVGDSVASADVRFQDAFLVLRDPVDQVPHANYLVRVGNADRIVIDGLQSRSTNTSWLLSNLVEIVGSASPNVSVLAVTGQKTGIDNHGTGSPHFVSRLWGGGSTSVTDSNVGIGTTSPQRLLQLHATTNTYFKLTNNSSGGQTGDGLELSQLGLESYLLNYESGGIHFGTSALERMMISSAGNVGIGTTSPETLLHIMRTATGQNTLLKLQTGGTSANTTADIDFSLTTGSNSLQARIGAIRTNRGAAGDTDLAFSTLSNGSLGERMRIMDNGNVGIGTSTPNTALTVRSSGASGLNIDADGGNTAQSGRLFLSTGTTGQSISIYNVGGTLTFNTGATPGVSSGTARITLDSSGNFDINTTQFHISQSNGHVGIGTTNPGQDLTVNGSVGFPAIATGAGTSYLCLTLATGVVSTSTSACNPSSIRFKDNVQTLSDSRGLDVIKQLRPVTYTYKPELKVPGNQVGFIAEEVYPLIPEVVGLDQDNLPANIDYSKLTPIIVKAIQELAATTTATTTSGQIITFNSGFLENLGYIGGQVVDGVVHFAQLVVDKLTVNEATINKANVTTLCLGSTCITESQLQALLNNVPSGQAIIITNSPDTSSTSTDATSTPPTDTATTTASTTPSN